MDTLLERTRTACLERARQVRRLLTATRGPGDLSLDEALRELHAIKGEAAMGGLRSISRLAHALETLLDRRRREEPLLLDDVCDALRIVAELLSSTSATDSSLAADVEDLLREVEAVSGADQRAPTRIVVGDGDPAAAPPTPTAASTHGAEVVEAAADASPGAEVSPEPGRTDGAVRSSWCRVDARSIDDLSNLVSEALADLDGARNQLAELAMSTQAGNLKRSFLALGESLDALRARVAQAEERAWSLRLVPIHPSLEDLAAYVEGLARQLGKQVCTEVDAGGVALERSLVEALREPLLHVARNAIDHGIERPERRGGKPAAGRVRFQAESQGSELLLAIEDDGVGLDVEAIRRRAVQADLLDPDRAMVLSRDEVLDLVFLHGFTQCDEISETSGRGVGLAAARRKLEGLGGAIRVASSSGQGARFEIVLPVAVARERVLVVQSAGLRWAIPSRWVRAVLCEPEVLARARHDRMLRTKEGVVPVRPLNAWLGAPREEDTAVLLVDIAGRRAGLLVARIQSEVDLLRTPTDFLLASATRVAASGILPDGRAVFFLRWAEVLREITRLTGDEVAAAPRASVRRPRVLVVDDSAVIRDIVGELLAGAGVEAQTAPDGKTALELLVGHEFDLVITDIEMPRMNGLELLQNIRQRDAVLPVVMLTTRSKPEHRREAALLGANAYIAKSEFQGDTLMEVVRRFVDVPA